MDLHDDDAAFVGEYLDFAEMSRDELQSKLFELLTLVETSRELLRARDAEDVGRRVLLSAIGVLGAGSACVLLRRGDRLRLVYQLGLDPEPSIELPLPKSLIEAVREQGPSGPFRVDEPAVAGAASMFLHHFASTLEELDADVVCPLAGRSGLLGYLILGRRLLAEGYSARDLDLFSSLAELYVLALDRATPQPAPVVTKVRPRVERAEGANPDLSELRRRHPPLRKILGESEAMARLFSELVEFADSRATILLQGESGTGKEVIARAVHELSRRHHAPLEIVDCSSIPKELIESELFGHVRGAFTGAVRDRRGAFDLAHNGTIFLDEIGDMTLASQTRLLRVLQEGKFRPVGGEKTHSVDVRVIAATNVDLREAVREGRFRKDLFFRIQVFPVWLPPLRERHGDVEVLTRSFIKRFYADYGLEPPTIEDGVIEMLSDYSFPGNVRELQNITEALAIRSRAERRVTVAQLEDVLRSMNVDPSDEGSDALTPIATRTPRSVPTSRSPRPVAPSPTSPPRPRELETGAFVAQLWRDAGFNLLEASRRLRARRLDGEEVAVIDRAQMSHYLDGEVLRVFLEEGGLAAAVARMAGTAPQKTRAARRIRRVVERLAAAIEEQNAQDAFPRLPSEYRTVVARLEELGVDWIRRGLEEAA